MWLVTDRGFVSLVVDRKDRNILQVRARVAEDITNNFPSAKVYISNGGDYRYRARVRRAEVAIALAEQIMDMDYDSHFKDVALARSKGNSGSRRTAYYGTWTAMAGMQDYAPYSKISRADVAKRPYVPGTYQGGGTMIGGGTNYRQRANGGGYEPVRDGFSNLDDDRYWYDRYDDLYAPTTKAPVNNYPGASRFAAEALPEKEDPFADWDMPSDVREDLFDNESIEPTDSELREIERTMGVDLRNMDDDTRDVVLSALRDARDEIEKVKAAPAPAPAPKIEHAGRRPGRTGSRGRRNRRRRR